MKILLLLKIAFINQIYMENYKKSSVYHVFRSFVACHFCISHFEVQI